MLLQRTREGRASSNGRTFRRPVFVQNTKTFVTEPVLAGVAGGEGARDNGSDEGRQDLADASDNNIVIH
ncbi:hypothetical protein [Thauera humireducens]|uniref:hypothetical protein n=1 Tax=Thauera humireducens TaxID=1134435 RepID=UPI0031201766